MATWQELVALPGAGGLTPEAIDAMVTKGTFPGSYADAQALKAKLGQPVAAPPVAPGEGASYVPDIAGPPPPAPPPPPNYAPPPEPQVTVGPIGPPAPPAAGPKPAPQFAPAPMAPPAPKGPALSMYQKWMHPELQGPQGEQLAAYDAMAGAEEKAAVANASVEYAKAATLMDAQKQAEALRQEHVHNEAKRLAFAMGKIDDMNKMSEDIQATKISPDHFWAERSTGQLIAAGIASIFGILGAPATGGVNSGVATIERAIARDIEAQKANLETKYGALRAKQSIYGQYLAHFGDERMAESAAMSTMLQGAKMKLDAATAMASGDAAIAAGQKAAAAIDMMRAKVSEGFVGQALGNYAAAEKQKQAAAAAAAAKYEKERELWLKSALAGQEKQIEELAKSGVIAHPANVGGVPVLVDQQGAVIHSFTVTGKDGKSEVAVPVVTNVTADGKPITAMGVAPDKEIAGQMTKASENYANLMKTISQLEALRRKYPSGLLGVATTAEEKNDMAVAQNLAATAKLQAKELWNLGAALSPGELVMLNGAMPDDILKTQLGSAASSASAGAGIGAAAGMGIASLPGAAVGGLMGAYSALSADPVVAQMKNFRDMMESRYRNSVAARLKIAPPITSGGVTEVPGKALPLGPPQ